MTLAEVEAQLFAAADVAAAAAAAMAGTVGLPWCMVPGATAGCFSLSPLPVSAVRLADLETQLLR
jgi:hypothetical protein